MDLERAGHVGVGLSPGDPRLGGMEAGSHGVHWLGVLMAAPPVSQNGKVVTERGLWRPRWWFKSPLPQNSQLATWDVPSIFLSLNFSSNEASKSRALGLDSLGPGGDLGPLTCTCPLQCRALSHTPPHTRAWLIVAMTLSLQQGDDHCHSSPKCLWVRTLKALFLISQFNAVWLWEQQVESAPGGHSGIQAPSSLWSS